jgi:ProP effector
MDRITEAFPTVFPHDYGKMRPLEKGIRQELMAWAIEQGDLNLSHVKKALINYCECLVYKRTLVAGAKRIRLDGTEGSEVTAEEQEQSRLARNAKHQLHKRKNKEKKQRIREHLEMLEKQAAKKAEMLENRRRKEERRRIHQEQMELAAARKAERIARGEIDPKTGKPYRNKKYPYHPKSTDRPVNRSAPATTRTVTVITKRSRRLQD